MEPPAPPVNMFRRVLLAVQRAFELKSTGKWFLLATIVGIVVGLAAIAFQFLSEAVVRYVLDAVAGYQSPGAQAEHTFFHSGSTAFSPWLLVVVMTLGGLVSGLLVWKWCPEAAGAGTDAVIHAFHHERGQIRRRVPIAKTLASSVTLGTGGSGGREGPIAQVGAGIGAYISTALKLTDRDRRILLAAGMAAGIGALFHAPLAAALFAGEIFYRDNDIESDVIIPAAISSIVGYSVYCLSLPEEMWFTPLFGSQISGTLVSPFELLPFGVLAILLVFCGVLYVNIHRGASWLFEKIPGPTFSRPAIGMGLSAVLAIVIWQVMSQDMHSLSVLSTGYGTLQTALGSDVKLLGWKLLLVIAIAKMITTSLTVGSGGAGGLFGPSMVIGGCLGAAFGIAVKEMFGGASAPAEVYAVVGMAGFFAGCAHAPFSTIIMVSEITGDYKLLLPTMWVCTICSLLFRRTALYRNQTPTRIESPAHRGDFIVDLLEGIKVADVFNKERFIRSVPESTSLDDIVHLLPKTRQQYYPVVDAEGKFVGIFSADDVRAYLYDETIWQLANARDIMTTVLLTVTPRDDLNTAMRHFTAGNLDELPVVDIEDAGKLLGTLTRKEAIAAYNQRLIAYKGEDGTQAG